MSKLRVVLAQVNTFVGDIRGNANLVLREAARARDQLGADLIVFPELTLTGYPPEDLLLRPSVLDLTEYELRRIQRELQGITVVVGYPHREDNRLFNAAAVIQNGKMVARYAKHELPNYSVFDEKRYFAAGVDTTVFHIKGIRAGVTVCEDVWTPDPTSRTVAAGAQILLNLNASPFNLNKQQQREEVVARRARDNGCAVLYVNQVGGQDELVFDGGSFVVDQQGRLTHRAPLYLEHLLVVDVDCESATPVAGETVPLPTDEALVYDAICLGVRDYVHKNGFRGAVLGLSGGIDSALTLVIAADALGPDQVRVLLMPSRYTAQMSLDDAREEAEILGVEHDTLSIEPLFGPFLESLAPLFQNMPADTTEENLQARCRGVLLMALSNKSGRILLTTGNKSEMAVGYATLYGDMAGGYAPLKDLFKTWVYRLARFRNERGRVIPERVITRPPSAELAPDQLDQDSLPPYEVLDPILQRYVEEEECIADIVAAGFERATVQRIADMVDRNEYKRRQAPPGVRITQRAFGRDRRYPITSAYRRVRPG